MKKTALLTLTILVLIGGFALYFLSSSDRQVVETFSTFGFKNDPTERPSVGEEEAGEYGVSGDIEELEEPDEGDWFTRWRSSGDGDADEPGESSGGGSDAPGEDAETTSGTLAQGESTGSVAPITGNTDASAPVTTTTATPKSYTLTVTSPTGGSVLSNKICPTSSDTTCYERPIATVFWTYGDLAAKITIELHNQSGLVRTLATKMSNSGRYTWNPSLTLGDGDYKLVVRAYSTTGTLVTSAETGYFEVSRVKEESVVDAESEEEIPEDVEKILDFGNTVYKRFNPNASAGKTIAYSFDFVGYEMGKISMVEDVNSVAGDNGSYTIWLSKTPGGAPITVKNAGGTPFLFEKRSWGWHGGTLSIASAKNPYGAIVLTPGKYYFNVTSALKTSYWAQINMTKDVLLIESEGVEKISKRWDLYSNLNSRVTVDLAGSQVGSVAFGSWRYYSTGSTVPSQMSWLGVTQTTSFTYPVGMIEMVVSPTEGSFTPISPECSLQTEETLALGRVGTHIKFTTKKFEELSEAQQRLGYCILEPDTKYYMNIRLVDRDGKVTCTADRCGFFIDVNYSRVEGYSGGTQGTSVTKSATSNQPQNVAEQAVCDEARDYYLSDEYSDWYWALVPSSRAYATAPGSEATAQLVCEQAVEELRLFGETDPWD